MNLSAVLPLLPSACVNSSVEIHARNRVIPKPLGARPLLSTATAVSSTSGVAGLSCSSGDSYDRRLTNRGPEAVAVSSTVPPSSSAAATAKSMEDLTRAIGYHGNAVYGRREAIALGSRSNPLAAMSA